MFCGAKLQRIFELCKSSTKKLPKFAYIEKKCYLCTRKGQPNNP